jgi:Fe-S cluster biogenesis protein NfuA
MSNQDDFQQKARSIETLVRKLEESSDPALRRAAQDLVQAVMELHGAGLERMLEIVQNTGDPGQTIIQQLGRDEVVRSVLLLYGLHPLDLRERVTQALEGTGAFLKSNGASAELASIDDGGVVTVHFQAKQGGCGSSAAAVKSRIEGAIQDFAPDAASIVVEDTTVTPLTGAGFVSIAELQSGLTMAALSTTRAQRSGD